jgi:predicted dehydrogenase
MASLGVAVIGTGFMGKCHAMAWSHVRAVFGGETEIRLEVLCDTNEAVTRQKAREGGFARAETAWTKLLDDPRIDVVSITTPNNLHRDMAIAFLEVGKHVWCEKPMALTLGDAEAMAAAAAAAKAKTLLGYNYLKNPALVHARKLVRDGVLGRIIHFRGQVDEDYQADENVPWSWRSRLETGGLGVLGDLTCHLVSFAHFLVGDVKEVCADIETVHKLRPMPGSTELRAVENEDIAHAMVRFESGASGVLMSSRAAHGRKNVIRVEVHGTKGMIVFDQERMNELQLYIADEPSERRGFKTILSGPVHPPYGAFTPGPGHQLGFNELKVIECKHFLDCIESGDEPYVNFAEGLKIEKIIHGIATSAASRSWLDVR